MAYEQPLYLENLDYAAKQDRQIFSAMFTGQGVLEGNTTGLVATPGTGMTLTYTKGFCVIEGTASADQGMYLCQLSANQSVTIPDAPGAGLSRVDLLVAQLRDDDEDSGGNNDWLISVVEGTPAASSPATPDVPASSLALHTVTTAGTQTSITAGNIVDLRVPALAWNDLVGEVKMWAHAPSAPFGWHYCDGSAVSRTAYPKLFAELGVTWGPGDGSTTFNLPDYRGRAPIGYGSATAQTSSRALAEKVGSESVILTATQMPSHNHGNTSVESLAHNHHQNAADVVSSAGSTLHIVTASGTPVTIDSAMTALTGPENQQHVHATANAGSNGAHSNMQPSLVTGFIIRLA